MRKLIAMALVCNFVGLTSAEAARRDVFGDLNRAAPRGIFEQPADSVARQPFDRINSSAPVRKPAPGDDTLTGE